MSKDDAARLFDELERTDSSFARHAESNFEFLNRASSSYWAKVRAELEAWFSAYPPEHSADLRSRFRSPIAQQHWPAWWELYLFTLFSKLQFAVEVHPAVPDRATRPDFRCSRGDESLFVEAAVVFSGIVEKKERHGVREGWILDLLNEVKEPNFFVGLEFDKVGLERPRRNEVIGPIELWLASLDPDAVAAEKDAGGEFPQQTFSFRDWRMRLRAIPVSPEGRGRPDHRLLGFGPMSVGFVNDIELLGRSLRTKFHHYGPLPDPLVVVVLTMSSSVDRETVEEALFGRIAAQFQTDRPDNWGWVRQRNGVWMCEAGPVATAVSGVAVASRLRPWNCAHELPELWLNPWTEKPLAIRLPFAVATADDTGVLSYAEPTASGAEILDLPPEWPGPDKPFS